MRKTFYYDMDKKQRLSDLTTNALEVVVKDANESDDIISEVYNVLDRDGNQYSLTYLYSSSLDKYATRDLRTFMRNRSIMNELEKIGGVANVSSMKLVKVIVPNDYELSDCFFFALWDMGKIA